MNIQTPASHRHDPLTSYDAERHMNESGNRHCQQQQVLALVRRHPNCTAIELAAFSNLDRYQIQRRLPELLTAGLVERGGIRKWPSGRGSHTWHAKGAA